LIIVQLKVEVIEGFWLVGCYSGPVVRIQVMGVRFSP